MPIPKPHSLQPTVLGLASLAKILVVDDRVVKAPESVAGSRGSNLGVGEDVLDARPALRPVPGLLLLRGLRKEDCQLLGGHGSSQTDAGGAVVPFPSSGKGAGTVVGTDCDPAA